MYAAASHQAAAQHSLAPYLATPQFWTPLNESQCDPHDPAWCTPQLPPASNHFSQSGFTHDSGGAASGYDEEQEVLASEGGMMEYEMEVVPHRRYSEGDQLSCGTSDKHPYALLQSVRDYRQSPTRSSYFDSSYTLVSAGQPGVDGHALLAPIQLSSGEISPGSPSFPCTTRDYSQQRPRALGYEQHEGKQHVVEDHAYSHFGHARGDGDYDVLGAPAQPYSTMAYTIAAAPMYGMVQHEPPTSVAPQQIVQPTPRRPTQPSVLAAPAFPQGSTPSSASNTPLRSPFVGFASPSQPAPSSSGSRSRRPSIAHAHTQAAPEFVAHCGASGQHVSPTTAPPPTVSRHHSYSGLSPQQLVHFERQQQREGAGRRHSVQVGLPASFAPYPLHSTRRRSSQAGVFGSIHAPGHPSGLPWTPSSTRRSSVGQPLSIPSRLQHRPGSGGQATGAIDESFAMPSPYQPRTPSRRPSTSVAAAAGASGSLAMYPSAIPSTAPPSYSSSAHRPHPNLSISVGSASSRAHGTVAAQLSASTTTSGMGPYRSPHYELFSPFSSYSNSAYNTPATGDSGCSPMFHAPPSPLAQYSPAVPSSAPASARDARSRRYSADPYAMSMLGTGVFHSSARAQESMRRASAAAAAPTTVSGSSLAGFAGHSPAPAHAYDAYGQQSAYGGLEESTAWMAEEGEWPVTAHPGAFDAVAVPYHTEGTVGLELEMGLEDMHLAIARTGIAPGAMYAEACEEPYDAMGVLQAQQQTAYNQLLLAEASAQASHDGDRHERVQGEIREYLRAEDGMELGEKTVVIMNPKIARRSYGKEKRLLAPPPMVLLLGSSWWSTHVSHPALSLASGKLPSPPSPTQRITLAPEIFLSISSEKSFPKVGCSSQWIAGDGKLVLEREEDNSAPRAGRALSKSLAVNVTGELNKEVSTTVNTVVTICEPGPGEVESRVWARFFGKPMSVISKPSKKRAIVSGNIAGLNHGSLVSLYNRTKTYSGSTRYLCTSGVSSMFPSQDWASMTGGEAPRSFAPDARDLRLVAKTNAWDAFIVYAADVDSEPESQSNKSRQPGFPPAPSNALPFDPKIQRSMYYNQTVVLQELATGVVSPVLVLRRVDTGNVITGGGAQEAVVPPPPSDAALYPTLPGECLGEPVSQYRPIALEVARRLPAPSSRSENMRDSFLGVVDDEVGMYGIDERRTYVSPPTQTPRAPITPTTPGSGSFGASLVGSDMSRLMQDDMALADPFAKEPAKAPVKPRTSRRASAETSRPAATLAKSKKHGASATALYKVGTAARNLARGPEAGLWTLPLGEAHVWSMVQVDVERHTFFVPPSLDSRNLPLSSAVSVPNPLYRTPRPRIAIGPEIPTVHSLDGPLPASARDGEAGMLALKGRHLSPDTTVWIGGSPCPQIHFKSPELVLVRPPLGTQKRVRGKRDDALGVDKSRRIALVRPDGVVFLTQVRY